MTSGKEEEALVKRPKHLYSPPHLNQENSPLEAFLYIATGKQHIQEAVYSVSSLKKQIPHVHPTIFLNGTIRTGLTHGHYMSVSANAIHPYIWCFKA